MSLFQEGLPYDDDQTYYVPVKAKQFLTSSNIRTKDIRGERKDAIQKMYESFKTLLRCLIMRHFRKLSNTLKEGDVILTLSMGKGGRKQPTLDVDKGNIEDWTLPDTLYQYFEGVRGHNKLDTNIPDFAVVETLRYLHSNPATKKNAIDEITKTTPFRPVLPNCVSSKGAFVSVANIIANDIKFLESINKGIKRFNPRFALEVKEIKGNNSEITLKGNLLILSHNYIDLVLKMTDESVVNSGSDSKPDDIPYDDLDELCQLEC